MRTNLSMAIMISAGLMLAGCNKEATGQVAAIVNGDEITLQEINAELASSSVSEGTDKEALQKAALQRIVDRRLMAQAARTEGLNETPEFLLRQRQLEDALLAQMLTQKAERTTQVPDQAAIDRYIRDNASLFGERIIFSVDRIQFPLPGDLSQLDALEDDHSMSEVAQTLTDLNIKFQRGPAQVDSLQLGPERSERIRTLPQGEPFVIPESGMVTVAVVTDSKTQPIVGEQARPLALDAMRNEQLRATTVQRLESARAQAKIEYQEGFAPDGEVSSGKTAKPQT